MEQNAPNESTAGAVAALDRLGLSPEEFAALSVREWAPIPERLRKALDKARNDIRYFSRRRDEFKPGTPEYNERGEFLAMAKEHELAILALPWRCVGVSLPDTVPELDRPFGHEYRKLAQEVRGKLHLRKPAGAKKEAARRRMEDLALRAARLCDEEDATPWLPKVRKLGSARFGTVLEKAETMKRDGTKDKDGKEIGNWKAYLGTMLKTAEEKTSTSSSRAPR